MGGANPGQFERMEYKEELSILVWIRLSMKLEEFCCKHFHNGNHDDDIERFIEDLPRIVVEAENDWVMGVTARPKKDDASEVASRSGRVASSHANAHRSATATGTQNDVVPAETGC